MTDADLIRIAKERFKLAQESEREIRDAWLEDMSFMAGNHWPEKIKQAREGDPNGPRPCLTINKLPAQKRQVINDIRQNKPAIKVRPVGDGADVETAEIFNGLIRNIEAQSNADQAYITAADRAIGGGFGYIRVDTDWTDEDSFTQDIFIRRIINPMSVYLYGATEIDGSDATAAFIVETRKKEDIKAEYPGVDYTSWEFDKGDGDGWLAEDECRVADYFYVEKKPGNLYLLTDGSTYSDIDGPKPPDEYVKEKRSHERRLVKWARLAGDKVLEKRDMLGKYIPLARVTGEEVLDGDKINYASLIRYAKDPSRMYDYMRSAEVEFVALAPKAPFVGQAGVFNGYEHKWGTANTQNHAYLEYNSIDNNGQPASAPQRQAPPLPASGFIQAALSAADDIKATTGLYDASLGQRSNETSGRAIMARQREGDVGTFHFVDNLGLAIRHIGRIIVDLIPKVYDTARIARILGEDGSETEIRIDPNYQGASGKMPSEKGMLQIFNPTVGKYDVEITVGPSYTTKRMEAAESQTQMIQAAPALWGVVGDLIPKSMDWPGADEWSKRIRKTIPPNILEDENQPQQIPPQVQQQMRQMQDMIKQLDGVVQAQQKKLEEAQEKTEIEQQKLAVQAYDAETKRIQAVNSGMTPEQVQLLVIQTLQQAMQTPDPTPMFQPVPEMGQPYRPELTGQAQ